MKKSLILTETAVMLALGCILGMLKIIDMPFGGSVTVFSMLPIIIISYRHGIRIGLIGGFATSLIQMITGLKTLTYATSAEALTAIIFLDYIMAFTVMGLGCVFKKSIKDRGISLAFGAFTVCLLRYLCHVISGCTVWAGISIPTVDGLFASMAYNAAYMVPETAITVAGAYYAGKIFTLDAEQIKRIPLDTASAKNIFSFLPTVIAFVLSFVFIFAMFQTENGFDITAITRTDIYSWLPVIILILIGAVVTVALKRTSAEK